MSFLSHYLAYTTQSESPEMYNVFGGYSVLATAIGRRVWLPRGSNNFFCNLYTLFVGDAGGGKSHALSHVAYLIEHSVKPGMVSYDVETPEGLLSHMAGTKTLPSECMVRMIWPDGQERETAQMTIVANEFIDFIRTNPETWTGFLNNIYDKEGGYTYRTKGCGTNILIGPYMCLIGAIPTDVSKSLQRQELINTGFARRCIMQYGERQYDKPFAEPIWTEVEENHRNACVEHLKHIQTLNGPLVRPPSTISWWKSWYDEHSKTLLARATPWNKSWLSSKPTQMIKLAMLNSLSERDNLIIIPEDFELALAFLNKMEEGLFMIFGSVGRNELAGVSIKVLEYLRQQKRPVLQAKLEQVFFPHLSPGKGFAEMREMLQHLVDTNQIYQMKMSANTASPDPIESWSFIIPEAIEPWYASEEALTAGAILPDSQRAALRATYPLSTRVVVLSDSGTSDPMLVESGNGTESEAVPKGSMLIG